MRSRRSGRPSVFIVRLARVLLFVFAVSQAVAVSGQVTGDQAPEAHPILVIEDAERFAALLTTTAYRPSARELERAYLAPGTTSLKSFAQARIGPSATLAQAVQTLRPDYRRATDRCLPAARRLADDLPDLMAGTREVLGLGAETRNPRVVVLFGAGRSAGTVIDDTVILGLEVICRFDSPERNPFDLLRGFLVHEIVHAHQLKWQQPERADSLLRQAMLEGYADLVTEQVLGAPTPPARERASYGSRHEARLWEAFREDMAGKDLAPWMYGPGRSGEPADLGYWLGLRISEAVLSGPEPESSGRRALLLLEDPFALLEQSAYGEDFPSP
jgi:hypothetical protein